MAGGIIQNRQTSIRSNVELSMSILTTVVWKEQNTSCGKILKCFYLKLVPQFQVDENTVSIKTKTKKFTI